MAHGNRISLCIRGSDVEAPWGVGGVGGEWGMGELGWGSNMYLISPYMGPEEAPHRAEHWLVQTQWLDDERKVIYELREERRGEAGKGVVED